MTGISATAAENDVKRLSERTFGLGREILSWYSGMFFSRNPLAGILLMLATTGSADFGVSALACPFLVLLWGKLFEIPEAELRDGSFCINAVLFGLYAGNTFSSLPHLAVMIVSGSFMILLLTRSLNNILWNKFHLPTCSYSFVFIVFLFTFLYQAEEFRFGTSVLKPMTYSAGRIEAFFHNPFILTLPDRIAHEALGFVFSVGAIFFQKSFLSCLLATAALVATSRITSLMAMLGYAMNRGLMAAFPFTTAGLELSFGFNAVLIGIAVGSGFFVPGKKATALMLASQVAGFFAGLACIAVSRLTGGDWTALPFNLVVSVTLLAVQGRAPQARPMRPGIAFDTPEDAVAYYRRYEERIFLRPIALPVFGRWRIVQGFDGSETHKEQWRYGVDLAAVDESGSRFRSTGINIEDYYAFDAPVLSPVEGVVSAVWAGADDNNLGGMNLAAPWGNFVLIHSAGIYIGLYHLKKGSILVTPGQTVFVGTPLGYIGNSGRSALPHLHLQAQLLPVAGAATIPFLFHDLLIDDTDGASFRPFFKPEETRIVSQMPTDGAMRARLFPRNGESWRVDVGENGASRPETWTFTYSLHGNVIVTSDTLEEIEYHVGPKCVEVIRFTATGLSPLALFALSLSEMPFALKHDLHWKTVLFGRHAYPLLGGLKRALSWVIGDLFSAVCSKTALEETRQAAERKESVFTVVTSFDQDGAARERGGLHLSCVWGDTGFSSLKLGFDEREILHVRKLLS